LDKANVQRLFVFGLGYVGLSFALAMRDAGWKVEGTCRTEKRRQELIQSGLEAFVFDGQNTLGEINQRIVLADAILSSVPPDTAGDPVLDIFGADILRKSSSSWLGYLSTTGVYGDWDGKEVNESSRLRATSDRGLRRIAAEKGWLRLTSRKSLLVHIFRLAGIYGPGRNILDKIRAGTATRIQKPGHVFSRIHVDDIVSTLAASILRPRAGAIYNVCDNEPCSQPQIVEHGCQLLGQRLPPLIDFEARVKEMSPLARSFWEDRRRVSNRLIREELMVNLRFPTYREGLASLV
tara:strand:+ start:5557 stop:6435 length:879 start_codon:yes stop_codon:yes gene_type:complete